MRVDIMRMTNQEQLKLNQILNAEHVYFNTNSIRTSSLCYINNTDQGNKILQHLKDLTRNYNNKP